MKNRNKVFIVLGIFLAIFLIGNISAVGCCVNKEQGSFQNVDSESECIPEESGENGEDVFYGIEYHNNVLCEDLAESEKEPLSQGCCVDRSNSLCTDYVIEERCEDSGLEWESSETGRCEDIQAETNMCEVGCCVINGKGYYETSMACEKRTGSQSDMDFRDISEGQCKLVERSGEFGACVGSSGSCSYEKRENCETGNFHAGIYCSDESLESEGVSCISGEETGRLGCIEGEKDVYHIDSCGNEEDVAEVCSSKEEKCGLEDGEYSCVDLTCESNYDNKTLLNGESRCIYEGSSKDGSSPVGSTHWVETCFEGEIQPLKACGEGRSEVCQEVETNSTGFTRALCVPNSAEECLAKNTEYFEMINDGEISYERGIEELESSCEENSGCIFKSSEDNLDVDVDGQEDPSYLQSNSFDDDISDYFGYDFCVPKEPKASYINENNEEDSLCSLATSTCTVYFQRNTVGRYECVENCDCLKEESFVKMNDLCMAMGDCGINVNIKEDLGENELSYSPYGKKSLENAFTDDSIRDHDAILARDGNCGTRTRIDGTKLSDTCDRNTRDVKRWRFKIHLSWMVGYNAELLIGDFVRSNFKESRDSPLEFEFPSEVMQQLLNDEDYATLSEEEKNQRAIEYVEENSLSLEEFSSLDQREWSFERNLGQKIWRIARFAPGTLAVGLFELATGKNKVNTVDVEYQCLDWLPPTGGDNCGECGEGNLPCTEYKCSSLGTSCVLTNKNTTNPVCVSSEDDGEAPSIESMSSSNPDFDVSLLGNEGWEIEYDGNGNTNGCVPQNYDMEFSVGIDEISICKYGFESYSTYSEIPPNFPVKGSYLEEHSFSADIGNIFQYLSDSQEEEYSDCLEDNRTEIDCAEEAGIENIDSSLKIRCEDIYGHFSEEAVLNYCVDFGPDENPPRLRGFNRDFGETWEYNPDEINLVMYLDELAECRYDRVNVLDYKNAKYEMSFEGKSQLGWAQRATLENSQLDRNRIYIKCNDTSGNINGNIVYEYNVKRDISKDEFDDEYGLIIDSISIVNNKDGEDYENGSEIVSGKNPSLKLEVETSRGIDNGIATCYVDHNRGTQFYSTDSTRHYQTYNSLSDGKKKINILCEDDITEVRDSIEFDLIVDGEHPVILDDETIKEGDFLTVFTDEEARCSYEHDDADFSVDEGNYFYEYESGFSTEHNTAWDPSKSYYINCVDEYGNEDHAGIVGDGKFDGPIITRIQYTGNNVEINTDRESLCYYNVEVCDFDVADSESNSMGSSGKTHSAMLTPGTEYYVKCEDDLSGIVNPQCTTIQAYL